MKKILPFALILLAVLYFSFSGEKSVKSVGQYRGTQACSGCHSSVAQKLNASMHSKIHLPATSANVRPAWTGSVSMGSAYSNVTATLAMTGSTYQITLNPTTGSPVTYDVVYTYGYGWKQRYLVKIENSYYIMPIQWNLKGYKDNSSGTWAAYNPNKWFTTSGTLLPLTNKFRTYSWDKNCSGCHITGNKVTRTITGADTAWVSTWANNSSNLNMTVGCESCHGPGSFHTSSFSASDIFGPTNINAAPLARQQEMCGQCHSRSASTSKTYEFPWNEAKDSSYYPGQVLAEFYTNWGILYNVFGAPGTWPDSLTARQHHQQWQDMLYSKHAQNINCHRCHDPHGPTAYRHQLKLDPDNNDACLECHTNFGTVGNPDQNKIMAHTKHSYDPTNQNQTGGSSRCVSCHMATVATTANSYDIHSHSWKVVKPIKTLQKKGVTTPTKGMLNSCAVSCHRNPGSTNGTSNVPTFGIAADATLTDWTQSTDSILADTLNRWFNNQVWTQISTLADDAGVHSLEQNYPNPFQGKTQINFSVPVRENVSLIVYDITGKEVCKLAEGIMEKGTYTVNFDATNFDYVSSNIYFYQFKAGNFTQTKKMICLK